MGRLFLVTRKVDLLSSLTIDVEEWFHVLDTTASPDVNQWDSLECRVDRNVERLLETLEKHNTHATFFWLGWVAQRHKKLVRKCIEAGHEVASHGFAHVLAYEVGPRGLREDVSSAKRILEDITGHQVRGFRAPGFGIIDGAGWAFEVIREAGHHYDASAFPAARGHGGMPKSPMAPHVIRTKAGPLVECPMSVVNVLGRHICLFSGGYLRISPICVIRRGIDHLRKAGRPLIVLIHPREVDPEHPRLPVNFKRRFKCYVNLKSTLPKCEWLCQHYQFVTMAELAQKVIQGTWT